MNSKLRLISLVFGLSSLISFTACTDYQEEFDNNFGALEYADDSGEIPVIDSSPSGDILSSSDEDSNDPVSSSVDEALSSAIPASSGTEQSTSSKGKSSSSEKTKVSSSSGKGSSSSSAKSSSSSQPSSSSAKSSSSMKSSSSVKSSSSLAYHFQLRIPEILYNVVTIGKQTWMADNMAEDRPPTCYYPEGKQSNWKYGRLYEWSTAKEICPEGWHLPDSLEWQTLFDAVGGIEVAGEVLQSQNVYGTVEEMFAGFRNSAGEFNFFDKYADFWINDESGDKFVELQRRYDRASFMPNTDYMPGNLTGYAYSVRCIMDYITDERDGQTYRTVKIGDQVWTAENMNYKTEYSHCFNDSLDYCEKYGRLYKWDETSAVCPSGWHLPSKEELEKLINTVGGEETAGDALKTKTGWKTYSAASGLSAKGVGEDSFGFSALPGGFRTYNGDVWYSDEDAVEYFCSSTTVDNGEGSYYMVLNWAHSNAEIISGQYACSVRCLKD